jgi:photosystem II stability/assembly factor-like uncharacterized protein
MIMKYKLIQYSILIQVIFKLTMFTQAEAQWVSTGLDGKSIVTFASIGDIIIVGTRSQGIHRSTDHGQTWIKVSSGDLDLAYIEAITTIGDKLIAGTNIIGRATYESIDSGMTWNPVYSSVDGYVTTLTARHDTVFAGTYTGGVYRSTNKGITWTHMGSGDFLQSFILSMIWIDSTIYVGTHSNWLGIWKSTDAGNTWQTANSGLPLDPISGTFRDIQCFTVKRQSVYTGTGWGGCYSSTNDGLSWDSVNQGLPPYSYVFDILSTDSMLYLASDGGFYESQDDGLHWIPKNSGLPVNETVLSLFIHSGFIYAGISGHGVWKTSTTWVTSANPDERIIPLHFSLEQNFPNPFNPVTMIRFSLPRADHVTLDVSNMLGEIIRTMIHSHLEAGDHFAIFDAKGFPSGVYLYRLKSSSGVLVKKMMLIK